MSSRLSVNNLHIKIQQLKLEIVFISREIRLRKIGTNCFKIRI